MHKLTKYDIYLGNNLLRDMRVNACVYAGVYTCVTCRVWQKEGRLERGWECNNTGIMIYSCNVNISPKTSDGVVECDIVMLQSDTLKILQ